MPIYRYQCTDCGAREEHLQKVSDPPVETCEVCGGTLSKLMTAAAFHLKGGGWYKDLYASSKSGADSTADSKPAKTSSADAGSTTTTPTPAAAPASTPSDSSKAKGTGSGSSNSTPSSAA
jgi:putative FmdB family regulatory protein